MITTSRILFFCFIASLVLFGLPGKVTAPVIAESIQAIHLIQLLQPKGHEYTPSVYDCSAQSEIPTTSCQALVTFYNSTNGPGWNRNDNWLVSNTPCSWIGVSCHSGDVNSLNLNSNNLSGTLPPEFGNLSNLDYLALSGNQLTGVLPPELGNLSNLTEMILYNNQLTGPIPPEFGKLSNLWHMDLATNQLTSIPPELGKLSRLTTLVLAQNQLSGSIPSELGNLSNLVTLFLFSNQLSGKLPPELGKLSHLNYLWLSTNPLSGPIPIEFVNLPLYHFYFSNTNLCEPGDAAFQNWKATVSEWVGTQQICSTSYSIYLPIVRH